MLIMGCAMSDAKVIRLIAQLMMPVGLVWLGLIAATCSAGWARRPGITSAGVGLLMLLTIAMSNWAGSWMLAQIEANIPQVDAMERGPFDAILVMGGGSYRRSDGQPELGPAGDRLMLAAQLFNGRRVPLLVASGDLAEDERWLWGRLGISATAVICLPEPVNTRAEVEAYRSLIAERGWTRVGLISSAWHLPRALRLCARAGFAPEPLAADWLGVLPVAMPHEFIPSGEGAMKTQFAVHEWLGSCFGN